MEKSDLFSLFRLFSLINCALRHFFIHLYLIRCFSCVLQLEKLLLMSTTRDVQQLQDGDQNKIVRHHSYKELKSSLSSLSFAGDAYSGEKRHSLRSSNSVMGKIRDRTGVPV